MPMAHLAFVAHRMTAIRFCADCARWASVSERHQESTLNIARWLEERDDVARVLHPALPSFPGHELWKRDFTGSSGIFSFVLNAESPEQFKPKAHAFLDALSIFGLGWSWGGFESLAVHVGLFRPQDLQGTKRRPGHPAADRAGGCCWTCARTSRQGFAAAKAV